MDELAMRWWLLKKKRDYDKLEKRVYVLEEGLDSLATQLGYKMTRGIHPWEDAEAVKVEKKEDKED